MKYVYGTLISLLVNNPINAQVFTNKIVGVVYKINSSGSKPPVPLGATVFIPGIGSTTTDKKGYFSLDLSACKDCKAGEQIKIYVNLQIGYAFAEYTIPNNPVLRPLDIGVIENKALALNGIVSDKESGKFLKGVIVAAVIAGVDTLIPPTVTNETGLFNLVIKTDNIPSMQAIQLTFSGNDLYKDCTKIVFINQYEPIKVEMDRAKRYDAKYKFKVDGPLKSTLHIKKGDQIVLKADGLITVGPYFNLLFGPSGPAGLSTGMITDYNIFKNWHHAVLYFRFGEDDEWKFYSDKNEQYTSHTNGHIEFGINDKKLDDNSGTYNVEVLVISRS